MLCRGAIAAPCCMVPHWPDQPVDPGAARLHGSDNHHDTFMTRLFPFLLLLLATPAAAQSFYPNLAGQRYWSIDGWGSAPTAQQNQLTYVGITRAAESLHVVADR